MPQLQQNPNDEPELTPRAQLESVMREHNQVLFRIARAILRDDGEAEEVVQASYVAAYAKLHQFSGGPHLSAWLRKITVNRSYDKLRQLERERRASEARRDYDEHLKASSELNTSPEDATARREMLVRIEQAIDELPNGLRSVFVMREVQEMSGAETADSLGIEEGAVRVRLHRARSMMRRHLGDRGEELYTKSFHFAGERCDRIVRKTLEALGL